MKIIVAVCDNFGIGIKGKLPWRNTQDLKHFSKTTIGNKKNAIIMGRKTWDSLPSKPLHSRFNIILTRSKNKESLANTKFVNSINELLEICSDGIFEKIWVIGGSNIYKTFIDLNLVEECYVTHILGNYNCDTFFNIPDDWLKTSEKNIDEHTKVVIYKNPFF